MRRMIFVIASFENGSASGNIVIVRWRRRYKMVFEKMFEGPVAILQERCSTSIESPMCINCDSIIWYLEIKNA